MHIVAISGGLSSPSSSRTLATELLTATQSQLTAAGEEVTVELVELRDHAHAIVDNMLTGFPSGAFADVVESIRTADALIVVTPTFQAGISGLVKSFFDVIEAGTLDGLPVLMAATGGTERHSLVIEYAMRPLFAYMKARPVGTGIYAATQDFGGGEASGLRHRVERAVGELVDALRGAAPRKPAEDDFVDFETLLARR